MTQRLGAMVVGYTVQPYTPALMRAARVLSDRREPGQEMQSLVVEYIDPAGKLLLAASRASMVHDVAVAGAGKTSPAAARVLIRHDARCAEGLRKSERRGKRPNCRCNEPKVEIVEPAQRPGGDAQ